MVKLSTSKQLLKLSTRKLPMKKLSEWKQSRRKARHKIPLADTGGREADLVTADTTATFGAQVGRPIK